MKYKILIAGAALAAMAVSCSRTASPDTTISFSSFHQAQNYRLEGSAKAYETDSDLVFLSEARILMPEVLYGHNADSLRNEILKVGFDTVGQQHEELIGEVLRHAASEIGFTPVAVNDTVTGNNDGCFIVDGDVRNMNQRTFAYSVTVSSYQPYAAHGMYTTEYINYDLREGRIFRLDELVTAEGLEKLPDMLRKTARGMRNFVGPTDLTALPADNNFYVDLSGNLIFVYQPYEIASYAQGIIEVPQPSYQISEYLTPYGMRLLLGTDDR